MDTEKPKRKRATKASHEGRVRWVIDLIKAGQSSGRILEFLMQQEGICRRTAERALQEAKLRIGQLGSQTSDEELGLLRMRTDQIWAVSMTAPEPDIKMALEVLKIRASLIPKNSTNEVTRYVEPSSQINAVSSELESSIKRLVVSEQTDIP